MTRPIIVLKTPVQGRRNKSGIPGICRTNILFLKLKPTIIFLSIVINVRYLEYVQLPHFHYGEYHASSVVYSTTS